ncbi:MAG TPA: hypothetical protein VJB14_03685 [Planctomycetota bacterium]|nr:hypothetical protein [Planctomycetota bacterium]
MKVLLGVLTILLAPPQDPSKPEQLIQQLDSDSPDERDAAEKALLAAGEEVEPLLKKAAEEGKPEVRARCQDLLKQIALARKRRAFWAHTRPLTLTFDDLPLKEALAQLSKASGHTVTPGDVDPALRVTARIEDATFLRAVEAVCLSLNTWYRWNGAAIELGKARAAHSRGHAGPLLLSASLGRSQENDGPSLVLRLEWDPGIRVRWYDIEIDSAEDDRGGAVSVGTPKNLAGLAHRTVYSRAHALPAEGDLRFSAADHVDLTEFSKEATRLKSVKGRITLFIPEEMRPVRFEKGSKEAIDLGTLTATLAQGGRLAGKEVWSASLDLDLSRAPSSKHRALFGYLLNSKIRFLDASGTAHPGESGGAHSGGNLDAPLQRVGRTLRCDPVPAGAVLKAVEATIVTDVWEKTYPFELKDVGKP